MRTPALLLAWLPLVTAAQGVVVVGRPEAGTGTPTAFSDTIHVDADPAARVDLADVVSEALGADLRRTGGAGRPAYLSLRGGTAQQLAVFLDDIPLHGSRGGAFDLSTVPVVYIDRAEVLRGPAAAVHGGRAQGGVLKLHTRRAPAGTDGLARLRMGSTDLGQLDGAVTVGGDAGDLLVAGGVSAAEGDFVFEDTHGETRRRHGNDHQRASGLVRGRVGPWALLVEGTAGERGEPGSELVDPDPDARVEDRRLQAGASWRDAVGPLEVQALTFVRRQDHTFVDPDALLGPARSELTDHVYGGRVASAWAVADHRPWVAFEGRHERARGGGDAETEDARTTVAAALGEVWRPLGWLTLSAAARITGTDERAAVWVPQAGVAVGPWGGLSLRANVGRIFRDPSFDELHFRGQGVEGNPDLDREDGVGADVGVRFRIPRRLILELAWFEQRYERLILWVPVNAYRVQPEDDFGATVRGLEAGAALRVGPLRVRGTYLRLDHAFDHTPNAPLPFRPDHALGVRAAVRLGDAVAHGGWRWRGAVHSDRHGHRTLPGYATWDLGLRGPVGAGVDVGLEVRNLTDAQGRDAVHQPLPGRTWLFIASFETP